MHFGEYELFPSLIGLSPLPSGHPKSFQRQPVRSSTLCYQRFNLPKGRSPGFASTTTNYCRPIQTRFRCGFVSEILILAGNSNSQAHYAKGTPSQLKLLRPLVSVWFQGLFHSVIHGAFHLSLTVLVHYRSLRSIQPYRMVPAVSDRVPRAPPYSGYCYYLFILPIRDYHPLWLLFPKYSNSINSKYRSPTTPILPKQYWFGLLPFRSPLLWESLLFSSPPPTQMFQFSGFAHLAMQYIFNILGCPIRIFADQLVCANPRNFSQLITSFFASESLGIPHTPLHNLFVLVCSSFEFLVFSFKL